MRYLIYTTAGSVPADQFELPASTSIRLWMWRNWPAYTVKGNAIKCFRSLDYELQIALSGFKWQVVFFPSCTDGAYF